MSRLLKNKPVNQERSNMSSKKFCPESSNLSGLTNRVEELKTMFENRLNTLEKKMDLLITTCSSILSNCDDPISDLSKGHGHVCCAALLLPKIMVIDDFIKNTLINGDLHKNNSVNSGPVVIVPSGKPSIRDTTGSGQVISLNSEQDLPDGSWLGDKNDPKARVRVNIPPSILIHINERCQTPEKMALTLLDYLFPREVQAISNISGKGKHSKCQLDPLKIFAIRCHLVHKFSITEQDWYRIKQNIDAKCRAVWRKKINGLPLETNKPHFLRSDFSNCTDVDSDDCQQPSQILHQKCVLGDDQQFTLLQDGQTVKVFMDDEFKELLSQPWPDEPVSFISNALKLGVDILPTKSRNRKVVHHGRGVFTIGSGQFVLNPQISSKGNIWKWYYLFEKTSVESFSVDETGCFALVDQKLLANGSASPDKSMEDDSNPLLYSSSNSHSGSDFGSDKPDK